jgi:N-acetylglucosamine kinase-like BadF-type ATPase
MKLIADSGSTKTDWALTTGQGGEVVLLKTEGINPVHQSADVIRGILRSLQVDEPVDAVFFYGSGIRPELKVFMRGLLAERFTEAGDIVAESDLLGAARALCGHGEGIACILGTGANSCLYDGHGIVQNTPALGYILGDEGSGAVIGRNLLNAMYKNALPEALRQTFEQELGLTLADVIRKVYKEPMPNRWLASLSPFIHRHILQYPQLSQMVVDTLQTFLHRNVLPYNRSDLKVSAVGSIAWYYQTELAHAATLEGMGLGRVTASPLDGLIAYHSVC